MPTMHPTTAELARLALSLPISTLLARRGYRTKSLSSTGAAAAFVVGFLSCLSSTRFGATLLVFYLASTRATRYNSAFKAQLEDGHSSEAGNRSAVQVLASSLPAVLIALAYLICFRHDAPIHPTDANRSTLLLAYCLFFAACAGDTFASELGIVLPGKGCRPALITAPWRRVPRGTNGAISWQGTLASAVGGLIVGIVFFASGPLWDARQLHLLPLGILGGIFGSAADSVLGAVVQASWLDVETGKVLREAPLNAGPRFVHVCGRNLLGGEAVNLVAAVATMALAPLLLPMFPNGGT